MKKLGAIILTGLLWGSFPAVAAYADHDDGGCWDGECYDGDAGGQSYDGQWSNEDRNRNRNRNRGSFSPGPFDDSPVTVTICAVPDSCPQHQPEESQR